jgi:hypothetical protein
MTTEFIYHYTDINTLALILQNRTIRFNRLDKVDDITEGNSFKTLKLEEFFFISCWTHDQNESISQWNMYTRDLAGVRITLPVRMFDYKTLIVPDAMNLIVKGELISPIPFDKIFGEDYMIQPLFLDDKNFGRKIIYVDDFMEIKNKAIEFTMDEKGQAKGTISDPVGIAALKSPDWVFQKEFRFVLFITPAPPIPKDKNYGDRLSKEFPNFVVTSLYKGKGPNIDFIDIDLNPTVINSIKIITGPLCNEGDYLIIKSLIDKYAPSGIVEKSKFTGTIRKPSRKWKFP